MWATFQVHDDEELDDPHVEVRVIARNHGRVVFDTTRLLRLHESQPNGPGCSPTLVGSTVLATPEGDLNCSRRCEVGNS
jgi:hypothetical protein